MMHNLLYLPLARKDLSDITLYIAETLNDPYTAIDLLDTLDDTISKLQHFPYAFRVYQPIKSLEFEYRVIPVKNYLVLYVVTEFVVEIHRIIYAKMDLERLIK